MAIYIASKYSACYVHSWGLKYANETIRSVFTKSL